MQPAVRKRMERASINKGKNEQTNARCLISQSPQEQEIIDFILKEPIRIAIRIESNTEYANTQFV